jgi:ATP-binding protein involved in chromosome partitioning
MTPPSDDLFPAAPDRVAVLKALDAVIDPKSGQGLAAAGLVQGLALRSARAGFMLEVAARDVTLYEPVRAAAEAALMGVAGVELAQVVLTTLDPAPTGKAEYRTAPRAARPAHDHAHAHAPAPPPQRAAQAPGLMKPAYVRQVIAVASGKGGVGKSTVAVNLAAAFAAMGYKTGLLDADVYGPSVPRMLGLSAEPEIGPDKKLIPLTAFGLKAASIGLLVKEGAPMIWRGPMASSALTQLLNDVAWGSEAEPLDLLVIDMPPGTGDVQLTLAQKVRLDGAVIVSTPQEVALIDVRRGVAMFQKTATPILGVVENMSYFPNPATGAPIEIFGRGGAKGVAAEVGAPFLGEIPIDIALRQSGDAGIPILSASPQSASARAFIEIAAQVAERLKDASLQKPPPRIIVVD